VSQSTFSLQGVVQNALVLVVVAFQAVQLAQTLCALPVTKVTTLVQQYALIVLIHVLIAIRIANCANSLHVQNVMQDMT
jgi:hypothetical protein